MSSGSRLQFKQHAGVVYNGMDVVVDVSDRAPPPGGGVGLGMGGVAGRRGASPSPQHLHALGLSLGGASPAAISAWPGSSPVQARRQVHPGLARHLSGERDVPAPKPRNGASVRKVVPVDATGAVVRQALSPTRAPPQARSTATATSTAAAAVPVSPALPMPSAALSSGSSPAVASRALSSQAKDALGTSLDASGSAVLSPRDSAVLSSPLMTGSSLLPSRAGAAPPAAAASGSGSGSPLGSPPLPRAVQELVGASESAAALHGNPAHWSPRALLVMEAASRPRRVPYRPLKSDSRPGSPSRKSRLRTVHVASAPGFASMGGSLEHEHEHEHGVTSEDAEAGVPVGGAGSGKITQASLKAIQKSGVPLVFGQRKPKEVWRHLRAVNRARTRELRALINNPVFLDGPAGHVAATCGLNKLEVQRLGHRYHLELYKDASGQVTVGSFFDWIGLPVTTFYQSLFKVICSNLTLSGKMKSFDDFVVAIITFCLFSSTDLLRLLFNSIDADNSGTVNEAEYMALLEILTTGDGAAFPGSYRKLLEAADTNHDGDIQFEEFLAMSQKFPLAMFPLFQMQIEVQDATLGQQVWMRVKRRVDAVLEEAAATKKFSVGRPSATPP